MRKSDSAANFALIYADMLTNTLSHSQISAMNSMPDIDMMVFLPEILHGLFEILADPALQRNCQSTLDSFLETIKKNPQSTRCVEYHEKLEFSVRKSSFRDIIHRR